MVDDQSAVGSGCRRRGLSASLGARSIPAVSSFFGTRTVP